MAEIESTIDLVMKKTEGLTLSDEEKRALELEKETRTAQIFGQRYLQGDLSFEELRQHWQAATKDQRRAMLTSVIGGIELGQEAFSRGLQALKHWKGGESQILKRFQDLSMKFGKTLQKRKRKIKLKLWADLAERGIKGSAVEPNVEVSPQWHAAVQSLQKDYADRLQQVKDAVLRV